MTKQERVNVPVTVKEKEELQKKAREAGYMSLSAYLRDKGLEK
jgi:hypothetical protein